MISSSTPAGPTGSATRDTAAFNQQTADAQDGLGPFRGKALVSAIIVVISAFLFFIPSIFKVGHGKIVPVLRVVLLLAVSAYLVYAHAGDAVRVARKIGGGIDSVRQQSEEKGKRAARAMKSLNALIEQTGPSSPERTGQDVEHHE